MKKVNGRCLAIILCALHIIFGTRHDLLVAHLQVTGIFHMGELPQYAIAPDFIINLKHKRGHQVAALRDQRIVSLQFILHLLVATALNAQHLVDLVQHGVVILKIEGRTGPDFHTAVAFDVAQARAPVIPFTLIGLHVENVVGRNGFAGSTHKIVPA